MIRRGSRICATSLGRRFISVRESLANDLETDEVLQLALVRLIEMIGEAASRVTKATCSAHPEIPWPQIVGMRNRLVHGYYKINLDLLWQTLQQDLNPLIEQLERVRTPDEPDTSTPAS